MVAYNSKKTEHTGPKKGRGAYFGRKHDAKSESRKARRQSDATEIAESLQERARGIASDHGDSQ